jgi:hypothetical protein
VLIGVDNNRQTASLELTQRGDKRPFAIGRHLDLEDASKLPPQAGHAAFEPVAAVSGNEIGD